MSAKKTANKKLKAGKAKTAGSKQKKVKLNIRVSRKTSPDLPAKEQAEPLVFEPEQKNVFVKKERDNNCSKPKKRKINSEEIEKSKNTIMRFGVAFFMILIISVWMFNFKKSFTKIESENNVQPINWSEITGEFSESISRVKEELDEAKSAINESVDTATGTEENLSAGQDEINELEKRLEELESKLENNEKQSTSTEDDMSATVIE